MHKEKENPGNLFSTIYGRKFHPNSFLTLHPHGPSTRHTSVSQHLYGNTYKCGYQTSHLHITKTLCLASNIIQVHSIEQPRLTAGCTHPQTSIYCNTITPLSASLLTALSTSTSTTNRLEIEFILRSQQSGGWVAKSYQSCMNRDAEVGSGLYVHM